MARSRTRPAGWYPDERDLATLRYWDGARWTSRRRPRPTWLPAQPLGGGATSLVLPPGGPRPEPPSRPLLPRHRIPATAEERQQRVHKLVRRARALALACFTALLAAVSALGVEFQIRHRQQAPTVHDSAFLAAARADCTAALVPIRVDRPPASAAEKAARVDSQVSALEGVAAELRTLPIDPRDQAAVSSWLGAWGTFSTVGHRYADALRAGDKGAERIAQSAGAARAQIDSFAAVNHLRACAVG